MIGIKSIIFKENSRSLIININNKSEIQYNNILKEINNEIVFKYLKSLFSIIDDWQKEYINTKIIDGDNWRLSIVYVDDSKKEYYGKSNFPINFEAFKRLNQKLIDEVLNG